MPEIPSNPLSLPEAPESWQIECRKPCRLELKCMLRKRGQNGHGSQKQNRSNSAVQLSFGPCVCCNVVLMRAAGFAHAPFGSVLAVKYVLAPVHTRIKLGEPVRTSCRESDFNFNRKTPQVYMFERLARQHLS